MSDLSLKEAIQIFNELEDFGNVKKIASIIDNSSSSASATLGSVESFAKENPWTIKEHTYAYIDHQNRKDKYLPLINTLNMEADQKLANSQVNIRIGNVYCYRYPGAFNKDHEVLFEFMAKHSPQEKDDSKKGKAEDVKFTQLYLLNNGESSGNQAEFALKGLNVPKNGINFTLNTILVGNKRAKKLVSFLNSPVFNSGLNLVGGLNPLLETVTEYANGVVNHVAEDKKKVTVQHVDIGFDFSDLPGTASLRIGTYVAIQGRRDDIRLSDIVYDTEQALLIDKKNKERIPYNHITFIVSKYQD